MYSHPAIAEFAAKYHQDELLRDARQARLAREAAGADGHTAQQHRVLAAAVAVLMTIALVVFI